MMVEAQKSTMMEGGFRGLDVKPIDVRAEVERPEAKEQRETTEFYANLGAGAAAAAVWFGGGKPTGEGFRQARDYIAKELSPKEVLKKTTFAQEAHREAVTTGQLKPPPKKKRRRAMMTKSINFGQQESAMTTINRSLRRTERMLGALEKKISNGGGATPAKGSTVGGT